LPGRTSIVLTRSKDWSREGVIVVHSMEEAIERAGDAPELAVIGGADVYRLAMPFADRIYLTRVRTVVDGDVKLPLIHASEWREVDRSEQPADDRHAFAMSFITLERVAPAKSVDGG
jgi:dihydrofolate reductase